MNIVALVGNLANEPEIRETSGGKKVCSFRLAVSRVTGAQADFFTVLAWDRQAEICKEFLSVGRRVAVEGRLQYSAWDHTEGEDKVTRRSKVEVVAHRVEMLGARPPQRTDEPERVEVVDDPFAVPAHTERELAPA